MTNHEEDLSTPKTDSTNSLSRSLLVRLRANEADAWDRLVSLYTPLVSHWCRKFHLDEQDISDVVQEVFKTVASALDRFRKDRPQDTFRGWLRTITHSRAMDHFRRTTGQPKATGGSDAQHHFSQLPEDSLEDVQEDAPVYSELFIRALDLVRDEFHEKTWKAFWRVVVDGELPKDVAQELSMQPGAVRVAKCRVLQRLRQELGDIL